MESIKLKLTKRLQLLLLPSILLKYISHISRLSLNIFGHFETLQNFYLNVKNDTPSCHFCNIWHYCKLLSPIIFKTIHYKSYKSIPYLNLKIVTTQSLAEKVEKPSHIHLSCKKNSKYFWKKSSVCKIICMTETSFVNKRLLTNISAHVNNLNLSWQM